MIAFEIETLVLSSMIDPYIFMFWEYKKNGIPIKNAKKSILVNI